MTIDEAGYLAMGVRDYLALVHGGLGEWLVQILWQNANAPLTSALASLVYALLPGRLMAMYAVPVAGGLLTIWGTFLLARRIGGQRAAWVAAIAMATLPVLVDYLRYFHFAPIATAATIFALYALVRCEGGRRFGWTLAFGLFAGLMPLARTMTVAYLPGLAIAALLAVLVAPGPRLPRLANFALAAAMAVAVAASWFAFNWSSVMGYLVSFGYGPQALEFGSDQGLLSRVAEQYRQLRGEARLGHFVVVGAGLVLALASVARIATAAPGGYWRRALASPYAQLVVFVVFGLAALVSTKNPGSAFALPLWPPIIILASFGLDRAFSGATARGLVAGLAVLCCIAAFVPMLDQRWPPADVRTVEVPVFGSIIVTDGRGNLPGYEVGTALHPSGVYFSDAEAAAWFGLNAQTLEVIAPDGVHPEPTAFGLRGSVFNVNTLSLASLMQLGVPVILDQVEPQLMQSVDDYSRWLATGAARDCNLLTSPGEAGEFLPPPDTDNLVLAAQRAGFVPAQKSRCPTAGSSPSGSGSARNRRRNSAWHR